MCGILLAVQRHTQDDPALVSSLETLWEQLKSVNGARGPDFQGSHNKRVLNDNAVDHEIRFFASELRLRGNSRVEQPHMNRNGDVFCWNGEVFDGLDVLSSENDGVKLFERILSLETPDMLPELFATIEGPYAFIYYHNASSRVFFGRDPLGRRSLLIHRPADDKPYFLLSSVSVGANEMYCLEELSTEYFYCLDLKILNDNSLSDGYSEQCLRTIQRHNRAISSSTFATPAAVNRILPSNSPLIESLKHIPDELMLAVNELISCLSQSVSCRVRDIPYHGEKSNARIAVLFSGGIDSTVLAYLADRHLPSDEPIDLLNVAFENPRKIRIQNEEMSGTSNAKKKSRRQKAVLATDGPDRETSYLVPDRVTGLEELEELKKLCPGRVWNFVEVDVNFEESTKARPIVAGLMFPSRTVMDMSLGLALYFASKGVGKVRCSVDEQGRPYTSTARVLLNGLGSDELLGGYGRHRTAFNSGGWEAVIDELQLEIDRIPTRNLGRDDRVISSHGKETRHPFLSLSVVSFLAGLPVHLKMDPRLDIGVGDKMLLRLAARKEGLHLASGRKKRAMQFGSHSARMEAGEGERRGDILLG